MWLDMLSGSVTDAGPGFAQLKADGLDKEPH